MTHIVVAREGVNINNRVILPGALRMVADEVPVAWNGDNFRIIGKARDMERNENNEITMEIELFDHIYLDLEDQIGGFVFVSPFESTPNLFVKGAISEVTSGEIKQVSLQDLKPEAVRQVIRFQGIRQTRGESK